jgi:hypothetical protein
MPDETVRLCNRRQQPVELHLPTGVLVLPPAGEALVPRAVLETPQVSWLLGRRVLHIETVDADAAREEQPDAADTADTSATGDSTEAAARVSPAVKPRRAAAAKRGSRVRKP